MPWLTDLLEPTPQQAAVVILRAKGNLRGEHVQELRRTWRRLWAVGGGACMRIELADVRAVDAAGRQLLREIHRHGVSIRAPHRVLAMVREEDARPTRARVIPFRPRLSPVVVRHVPRRRLAIASVPIALDQRRAAKESDEDFSWAVWLLVAVTATLLAVFVGRLVH